MTSAPQSARRAPATGASTHCDSSTTRMPSNGASSTGASSTSGRRLAGLDQRLVAARHETARLVVEVVDDLDEPHAAATTTLLLGDPAQAGCHRQLDAGSRRRPEEDELLLAVQDPAQVELQVAHHRRGVL